MTETAAVPDASPDAAAADLLGTTLDDGAAPEPTSALADELDAPAELTDSPADEPATAPVANSRVQKIVDTKFGGDWDKFTDSLYEQWNSSSRLHSELEELKELVARGAQPHEPEAPAPDHPDVKWLEQQITSLDSETASIHSRRQQILLDINKRDREVAALEGEMKRADDFDKNNLLQQRLRAETAMERALEKYENLGDRLQQLDLRKREFQYQRQFVDSRVAAERAQTQQRAELDQARQTKWQSEFLSAFEESAGNYKLSPEDKDYMFEVIVGQTGTYLNSLPKNTPAIDLAAYVRGKAEAHAKAMRLPAKTEFVETTRAKLATRTQVAPRGAVLPAARAAAASPGTPAPANKPITAAEVRARAARILGG